MARANRKVIDKYLEALKNDSAWFDDADNGYCPDSMVDGYGDIYLVRGDHLKEQIEWKARFTDEPPTAMGNFSMLKDDGYYLAEDWEEPTIYYEISRKGEFIGEVK